MAAGFPLMVHAFEGNMAETILWNQIVRLCSGSAVADVDYRCCLPVPEVASWRGVGPQPAVHPVPLTNLQVLRQHRA